MKKDRLHWSGNVSDHLAARDWVTIGIAAPFAAEVHPVVLVFEPGNAARSIVDCVDTPQINSQVR